MKKTVFSIVLCLAAIAPLVVRAQKSGTSVLFGGGGLASTVSSPFLDYHFDEGRGQVAQNYANKAALMTNLIYPGEQAFSDTYAWTASNVTVTDNYAADPNGNTLASRLVASATTATLQTSNVLRLEAVPHALSIYVKSNTGSTQTFRIGYTDGSGTTYSSNLNATTSWAQQTLTFTPTATNAGRMIISTDTTPNALDISIWGFQLERSRQVNQYEIPRWDLVFGLNQGVESLYDPQWHQTGIWIRGGGFAWRATGVGSVPVSLTSASIYAAVRLLNDDSNVHTAVSAEDGSNSYTLNKNYFGTPGGSTPTSNINTLDGNWHILTGVYDGSKARFYLDDALFGINNASTSITLRRFSVGAITGNGLYWNGYIGYVQLYTQAHNSGQVRAVGDALRAAMSKRSVTMTTRSRVIVNEGDSLTQDGANGIAVSQRYVWLGQQATSTSASSANLAVGGSGISNLQSRLSNLAQYYKEDAGLDLLTVLVGTNDLAGGSSAAQIFADLKAYCQAVKAAKPWKIMLFTVPSRTDSTIETKRAALNSLIVADNSFYDYIVRVDQNANIGCNGCYSNTTFFSDGVHMTVAGQAELGTLYANALAAIW